MLWFLSTEKPPHYLRREDTRVYRFSVARLREIAAEHGDHNPNAIARRTGINVSSAYRIHSGETQPDLISALRISDAYGRDVRYFMDRVDSDSQVKQPAGAAA